MVSKKAAMFLLLLTAAFILVPFVKTLTFGASPQDGIPEEKRLLFKAKIQEAVPAFPEITPNIIELPKTSALAVLSETSEVSETATIIFTFDDGYVSDYELAYPILKEYGIRGTSYIIPKYLDNSTPYALTWDMVKEMTDYGWVFGCHTYAHTDLTKMTANEIKESMEKVNESFTAQGLALPTIHSFPYGRYNQGVIEAIKPYRIQMRKAFYENKFVDPETADPYQIDSCSADMRMSKRLLLHEKLVDKAVEEKSILVFRCHGLYKQSVDDMGKWPVQTDSRLFKKLVEYCVKKGCRFMTMTELAQICSRSNKP